MQPISGRLKSQIGLCKDRWIGCCSLRCFQPLQRRALRRETNATSNQKTPQWNSAVTRQSCETWGYLKIVNACAETMQWNTHSNRPPVLENAVKPSSETQPQLELTLAWRKFDTRQVQWNLMTRHCNSSAQNHSRLKLGINKMIWQCNGWYSGDHDTGWRSAAAAYNQRFLRPTDRSTDRWSDLMKSTTCRSDALQANRSHGTKSPSDGFPIWMNAAPLLSKMLARSACCRLATKKQPPDARAFSAASLPDMPTRPVVTTIKSKDVWEVSTVFNKFRRLSWEY